MKVGFCGLGLMGAPMVRRLLAAGHEVKVWNRTPAKAAALASMGAQVVGTPAQAASGVDGVLMCLARRRGSRGGGVRRPGSGAGQRPEVAGGPFEHFARCHSHPGPAIGRCVRRRLDRCARVRRRRRRGSGHTRRSSLAGRRRISSRPLPSCAPMPATSRIWERPVPGRPRNCATRPSWPPRSSRSPRRSGSRSATASTSTSWRRRWPAVLPTPSRFRSSCLA